MRRLMKVARRRASERWTKSAHGAAVEGTSLELPLIRSMRTPAHSGRAFQPRLSRPALSALRDLFNRVGHQPVSLVVPRERGLGAGALDQAHDGAALGVEPVVQVLDVMLCLDREVPLMGAGHV